MTAATSAQGRPQDRTPGGRTGPLLAVIPVSCQFEHMAVNQRLRALLDLATVQIVTSFPGSLPPDIADRARIRSFPVSRRLPATMPRSAVFAAEVTLWSLARRLAGQRHEVVYTLADPSAVAGRLLRARAGRWIIDVLDDPAQSLGNAVRSAQRLKAALLKARDRVVGALLPLADVVLTIGLRPDDPLPRLLAEHYGVAAHRIVPVRQSVELARVRQTALARSPGQPDRPGPSAAFVGYVSRLRGVDTLLRAAAVLSDRGVRIDLVLVGHLKSRDRDWLDAACARLPGTRYTGVLPSEDALAEMARATVGVLPFPDRRETAPVQAVTGIEYLALGKAIVATDLPGARALVDHGVNGILVPPGDAVAMADAIAAIVTNPELAAAMGRASYERAEMFDATIVRREITHALGNR
ncbi:MAG: glycosyltransferase [Actinomycetota bacterium]|nr:glycosyltransferase [Actinomycetota bacterium]